MHNHQLLHRASALVRMAGVLLLATALPASLNAQTRGDGFLFGQPRASLSIRGGFAQPNARSEVFNFTADQLTVGKNDFGGVSLATDLGIRITERFDVQLSTGFMSRRVDSEFRDFVDNDDRPIEQYTSLRRIPMTAGVKYRLASPGRSLSRLAWIPAKFVPYVGAGGGMMYYSFKQEGDFVDFQTLDVFSEKLESKSFAPTAYAHAGFDYTLTPRLSLVSDARYDYARTAMGRDFQGFDDIDLSGVSLSVGFGVRF